MGDFLFVADVGELPEGEKLLVDIDGEMLLLFRIAGEYFCIDDVCTHDGGTLSDGEYQSHEIKCPRHGARFDVRTGQPLCMPATQPTAKHAVRIEDGRILVKLSR